MKFQYLGTAAYEGIPASFCNCEVCEKSRKQGGRNIRTRTQALVDDRLLIDFPADSYIHSLVYGFNLSDIRTVIVTHDHGDHFYPEELLGRCPGFGHMPKGEELIIYGSRPTIDHFDAATDFAQWPREGYLLGKEVMPYVAFEAEGYTIIPLKADHAPSLEPVFYSIEKNGKRMLYAHDTGYFPEETWEFLKQMDGVFDFVSLDCTEILMDDLRENHMGLQACVDVKERLIKMGRCDTHTIFCLNHFSHNGGATYDVMCRVAEEQGFLVSYDGLTLEF